jgi:hypothetical protein
MHIHAIGVPEGVTLLEFEGVCPEEQQPTPQVPQVQATEGVPKEEVVDYLDHQPCNFIKGKPRSIICLLISEIQLSIYVICIDALSYRRWLKTLAAYILSLSKKLP